MGGKIKPLDNSPTTTIVREFGEETGLLVHEWEMFCQAKHRGNLAYFFRSFAEGSVEHASGQEAEKIATYPVARVVELHAMPNLSRLIPMAPDGAANVVVDHAP